MVDFNSNENWPRQPAYDKGEAPKVTAEDIKNEILLINYVNAHDAAFAGAGQGDILDDELRRVTLCFITLKNGAVIVGQSACAHIDNYDKIKGEAAAYNDALRQCWGLMGFALRDRLGRMVSYQGNDGTTYDPDGGESFGQLKWAKGQDNRPRPEHDLRGVVNEQIAKLSERSMLREEAQKVLGPSVSDDVLDLIEQAQNLHAAQEKVAQEAIKEKIKADVERNIKSSRKGFFRFINTSEK